MNTPSNINTGIILQYCLMHYCSKRIRDHYKFNPHYITVLMFAYLYTIYKGDDFAYTTLRRFAMYYDHNRLRKYFDGLVSSGIIALAGSKKNRYKLTNLGLSLIQEINDNYDNFLYSFCQDHNIVL
jgi:predicted transcriptional regulator